MRQPITISLPEKTSRKLQRSAKKKGLTTSEYVRQALENRFQRDAWDAARAELVPQARAMGILTDDDVFREFPS